MMIQSINPATEELFAEFQASSDNVIRQSVEKARKAQLMWHSAPKDLRIATLQRMKETFSAKKDELVSLINLECGFDSNELASVFLDVLDGFDYYIAQYRKLSTIKFPIDASVFPESSADIQFVPLGVIAQIGIWNYPFWQTMITAIPALLTGNAIVYKPSEKSTKVGLFLAEIIRSTPDFHSDLFIPVIGGPEQGRLLVSLPVDAVVYTGNIETGKQIHKAAGLKNCILELSGNDAAILCSDCDFDQAISGISAGSFSHSGEVCDRIKRLYVVKEIADNFINRLTQKTTQLHELITPLIREDALHRVHQQVRKAVDEGARVLTGGKRMDKRGYYYEPTILLLPSNDCSSVKDEIFGPVLSILVVADEEEALRHANASQYGLGTSIWTQNFEKARNLAQRCESGMVWINDSNIPLACGEYFKGWKSTSIPHASDRLHQFLKSRTVITFQSKNKRSWWF